MPATRAAVAPVGLRGVEKYVGALDCRPEIEFARATFGDADAHGHPQLVRFPVEALDALADSLGDLAGLGQGYVGERYAEFLAAQPYDRESGG